jgi:3-hydroxyacyl-CoA dehydrogenase/enoyl-CoA hydratase/3-hydroxybutyryl-CoA epimerase
VLTRTADADLGSLLGWNYPAWTGGTLSYIDTIGIERFAARCEDLALRVGPRFAPGSALEGIDHGRN